MSNQSGLQRLVHELELIAQRLHGLSASGDDLVDKLLRKASEGAWEARCHYVPSPTPAYRKPKRQTNRDQLINELEVVSRRLHELSGSGGDYAGGLLRKAADDVWSARNRLHPWREPKVS